MPADKVECVRRGENSWGTPLKSDREKTEKCAEEKDSRDWSGGVNELRKRTRGERAARRI